MSVKNYRYLALLLCCFITGYAIARQDVMPCRVIHAAPIPIDLFTTNDGLSQGMMNSMTMDSDGYLWLGTNVGLNRFDGRTFKVYYNNPADTTSIAGNHVISLLVDAHNKLWIAIEGKGVDRFDPLTETFTHYSTANGLSSNSAYGQFQTDHTGQIIVTYEADIPANIIVSKGGSGKHAFEIKKLTELYPGIAKAFGSNRIPFFYFTATGDMWYYKADSLCRLSLSSLKTNGRHDAFETTASYTQPVGSLGLFMDVSNQYPLYPLLLLYHRM